jgi:hypothetical protein
MGKKCPTGFICTDTSTLVLVVVVASFVVAALWMIQKQKQVSLPHIRDILPKILVVQAPAAPPSLSQKHELPYPEPVQRISGGLPSLGARAHRGSFQQIGILTGDGGSSSSASPDRTILPLYGRELDARRGKWNYYTRTDGANPVQVPVRYRNKLCDDDTNGCDEASNDDTIYVPALGRSFHATVYRKSIFA